MTLKKKLIEAALPPVVPYRLIMWPFAAGHYSEFAR